MISLSNMALRNTDLVKCSYYSEAINDIAMSLNSNIYKLIYYFWTSQKPLIKCHTQDFYINFSITASIVPCLTGGLLGSYSKGSVLGPLFYINDLPSEISSTIGL